MRTMKHSYFFQWGSHKRMSLFILSNRLDSFAFDYVILGGGHLTICFMVWSALAMYFPPRGSGWLQASHFPTFIIAAELWSGNIRRVSSPNIETRGSPLLIQRSDQYVTLAFTLCTHVCITVDYMYPSCLHAEWHMLKVKISVMGAILRWVSE